MAVAAAGVSEGCGGPWRAVEGRGGLWGAVEGCGGRGGLWRAVEGRGGLWRATQAADVRADNCRRLGTGAQGAGGKQIAS